LAPWKVGSWAPVRFAVNLELEPPDVEKGKAPEIVEQSVAKA
jgi:hypothetical protein